MAPRATPQLPPRRELLRPPHTVCHGGVLTLAETDRINVAIREILDVATEDWGWW
jgi:hypothetical protein